MSALFAFEVGDVSMRSATFERIITDLLARSADPADRRACQDALDLNCLWVDQIDAPRKCAFLTNLHDVLAQHMKTAVHLDNEVAVDEIKTVMNELKGRYPECFRS
ncbi:hypothetical protein [Microbispora sp. H10830]|uniref:hypothetical protein n=1 Tax=Microbispora sp. H10830 TaxID=2729109 RepID=UPI0016046E19|nr:hypothetical protein [Microbispora sp. H10830]